jgi:hypothetical protein
VKSRQSTGRLGKANKNIGKVDMKLSQIVLSLTCVVALVGCVEDLGGSGSGRCIGSGQAGESAACESSDDCADGLRCFEQGANRFCVVPCSRDSDCGDGMCDTGDTNNNGGTNNGGTNNGGTNNGGPSRCDEACTYLSGCFDQVCSMPIFQQADCVSDCEGDEGFDTGVLARDCNSLNEHLCQDPNVQAVCDCPGTGPNNTNAGDPCTSDADCDGGNLQAGCVQAVNSENQETGFDGGYCIAVGCNSDEACGEGNPCVQLQTEQGQANYCLGGCNPTEGRSVCRGGYGCWQASSEEATAGACFPECNNDADCPCPDENPNCGAVCDADNTGGCIQG